MTDLLREDIYRFAISGKADNQAEALQKAFSTLRRKAFAEVPGPIVYMEPMTVKVTKRSETKTREAFMFLFFPRIRKEVSLELLVEVKIRYADFHGSGADTAN